MKQIDLAKVFELENLESDRRLSAPNLLSTASPHQQQGGNTKDATATVPDKKKTGDGSRPIVNISGLFELENCLTLLSASRDFSRDGRDDAERFRIVKQMAAEGKVPLRPDGFTAMTGKDLADMPLSQLKILANNCQSSRRVI